MNKMTRHTSLLFFLVTIIISFLLSSLSLVAKAESKKVEGDSTSTLRGQEIPTNGKKLKILVPKKDGYNEFVKVTTDPNTNTTQPTGFCINVFNAVLEKLHQPVTFTKDFFPFDVHSGDYDVMIQTFSKGGYDAIVGDLTIRASRTSDGDFTMPYTDSGVSMVVPVRDDGWKDAWAFLKPLSWDLWVTIVIFFVFLGFVVWCIEHRVNPEFRGPPSHQVGTSLWFSFSTMVFAQRERVVSNLLRSVVIIWCFVLLILTQSYTASFSSMLTVQQLKPTVTDLYELLRNKNIVGYQNGSFVFPFLKEMGFEESRLRYYSSVEECHELLSNGSIAAAVDEIPYTNLFHSKYCSNYAVIDTQIKSEGFGFLFPLGSPLVHNFSRAILDVKEADDMKRIEDRSFESASGCPSMPEKKVTSLNVAMFGGLFIITGGLALFALAIHIALFIYKERHLLSNTDIPLRTRVGSLWNTYNQRDLSSHTFKTTGMGLQGGNHAAVEQV